MKATESALILAQRLSLRLESHLALIFGLLGVMLTLLIALHWFLVLEPTLRAEAESRASVLAQAQVQGVEKLLGSEVPPDRLRSELTTALGDILLFKDPSTGEPFIHRISLRIDYDLFQAPSGSLDLDLGTEVCETCFAARIPLYDTRNHLLIGAVTCYSSRWFLESLLEHLLSKLSWVVGLILFLIGYAWLQTHRFLRRLRESETNLRGLFEAAPFPMVLKVDGEVGIRQANEAAKRYLDLRAGPTGRLYSDSWLRLVSSGLPSLPGETCETSLVTTNGGVRWALISSMPMTFSGLVSQLVTLVDVSELKATQEELRAASFTDALTGLFNRRYLYQRLASEIDLVQRYGHALSIILFDLDHFKMVNDTFGHGVGDDVLTRTAAVLKANLRDVDVAGRYGGEEFLVILPHSGAAQACEVAERIRASLADIVWPLADLHVTISGGSAQYGGETIDEFLDIADRRLYGAKRSGRNRVMGASSAGGERA
ncbi:sensor domain-containing diguanylate cyclase [Thiocystis violacea]|uniref:sensor domain-containing diguanylate cyclase n=1 Tax=Thiocystis violacea TaxID=13725 RepID=UPI001908624D|nr:sensor domain-containing diguanylate cyclase [Thiocystis violacea]MBK1718358.1 GGDEF domain-containing protein [Thiocystis violacea]